jgi:hypothetical protein
MVGMDSFPRCHLIGELQANRSGIFFHEQMQAVYLILPAKNSFEILR